MDLYLKFESQEQAEEILYAKETVYINENGMEVPAIIDINGDKSAPEKTTTKVSLVPKYKNIDVIGTIYEPTGETVVDEDGIASPVTTALEGYHVNIRVTGEDVSELSGYTVTPSNPRRVWA